MNPLPEAEPYRVTWKDHVWHYAYRHWYDNDRARNKIRAAVWGWLNDTLCVVLWPMTRADGTRRFRSRIRA